MSKEGRCTVDNVPVEVIVPPANPFPAVTDVTPLTVDEGA